MQKNVFADLFARRHSEAVALPLKSAPVELDASLLSKVGGGLAPRGTWLAEKPASCAVVDAPRGTWL